MIKWKYVFILIAGLALCTCRKEDTSPGGNNNNNLPKGCYYDTLPYLPADFVSYFGSYKTGSWWVYEDSTGKYHDSCYITAYRRGGGGVQIICDTGNNWLQHGKPVDVILLTMQSALFGQIYYEVISTGKDSASNSVFVGQTDNFTIYESNGVFTEEEPLGPKNTILASFTVSGVTYKNVLLCDLGCIAPGIGIIQTVYNHNGNPAMYLIKYHIVQ